MDSTTSKESPYEIGNVIEELIDEIKSLRAETGLAQQWYALDEACHLKGICTKTAQNQTWLQPNGGVEDAIVGRKKRWHRNTIARWLEETDEELLP